MSLPLLAALLLSSQAPVLDEPPPRAFVGVNVLTQAGEPVLDATVVIEGGRIRALGPRAELAPPAGAEVIAGEGLWLMPGLADMHVHTWNPDELTLFVANGVTLVRNMFGSPEQLVWRAEIERGARLGPELVTAGPIVDGSPPVWPGSAVARDAESARDIVLAQKEAGYDFIKVYARLGEEAYWTIIETAAEVGLPVEGHVPTAVGLRSVLGSGQTSIEHLDGYSRALEADDSPMRAAQDFFSRELAWNHVDPHKRSVLAEESRAAGVWNCPTVVVMQAWKGPEEAADELARPHMRYVPTATREQWRAMAGMRAYRAAEVRAGNAERLRFVGALHKAGARLLIGTDVGNPWLAAGFSLHDELENFVQAGIPPAEVLRIATRGAAEFAGRLDDLGTVEVGKLANLVLLDRDPREGLDTLHAPRGVMLRGRWLDRADLDERLAALAAKVADAEPSPATR